MLSPRKQSMKVSDIPSEALRTWYKELQEYNHPDDLRVLLKKYIGKDKVQSLGDIQKLKEAMRVNNISIMGYQIDS